MTETREESVTWLTQEAYDRLKAEFDHLSGQGRIDIAKKIEAAREEGDLRENGGYHAAKEEQGKIEGRILQLQHILENARVGEPPRTDGVVGPGMTVTVRFVREDEEVTFLLASREESGSPIDVYSPKSPLGSAISGKKVGEQATYSLPNGRSTTVEILEAVPYAARRLRRRERPAQPSRRRALRARLLAACRPCRRPAQPTSSGSAAGSPRPARRPRSGTSLMNRASTNTSTAAGSPR